MERWDVEMDLDKGSGKQAQATQVEANPILGTSTMSP